MSSNEMVTNRLIIQDDVGTARVMLGCFGETQAPSLRLYDGDGRERVIIEIDGDRTSVSLMDEAGQSIVGMSLIDNKPVVYANRADGAPMIVIGQTTQLGDGIKIVDENGVPHEVMQSRSG